MECTIKMARKYHSANGAPERYRIITFEGAFHGRTLATLAAGGQKKYLEGFGPVLEGFDHVPFADLEATKAAITPETGAILVEPIQGEGGVRVFEASFLRALRALCDERGLLLLLDEVQTGMGRSGELFAHQRAGIMPDIMGLAKGMTAGTHGSTFGGNPLAMSAAGAVLDVMLEPGFLERVRRTGLFFKQRLAEIKDRYPTVIAEVRGEGLLIGVRAAVPAGELVDALRAEKMITVAAGDNVVRLLPPLIISEQEISEGIERLDRACGRLLRAQQEAPNEPASKEQAVR
jgi:acetylornithine/N-succinyldiaminopimelate aminotransferase